MDSSYSIGIPVRNEALNIASLLMTLMEQTVPPVKIIVCVNGSTDATHDIAVIQAEKNALIEVIRSEPGKANAWRAIIEHVSTDKVLFCDGDVLVDKEAAEKLLHCLDSAPELILAGGAAWTINRKKTFFEKYFIAAEPKPPVPKWVVGRLYMIRLGKLKARAEELNIELMPRDTINDDGFLELITTGRNKLIREAFVTSACVDSFRDWRGRYVRILAGQKQLEQRYANLLPADDAAPRTAKEAEKSRKHGRLGRIFRDLRNTYNETRHLDSVGERMGIMFVALAKISINLYYKIVGGPKCQTTWVEAKSTKANNHNAN